MKTLLQYATFTLFAAYLGCAPKTQVVVQNRITGSELKPLGRFDVLGEQLELIGSGVHFGVSFKGRECTMVISANPSQHGYIQYELDGNYGKRVRIEGSRVSIKIAATSPGQHTLWIYKATEAHSGPLFVHELTAEKIRSVEVPHLPLLEFIGNSITCGAAADPSEIPCGSGSYHDQHNAYMAYGPRVARAVNANFILSSVSGIGIYRNWNSDGPVMPDVYEKTDLQATSARWWKFERYSPDVVTIALGTNDFSSGDGKKPRLPFDSATFTKKYVAFVTVVKSKYPKATIALLNSPMVSGARNDVFVDCIKRVKQRTDSAFPSDKPVSIFLFKPMKAKGCTGHPDVEDHGVMAEQLVEFYRSKI